MDQQRFRRFGALSVTAALALAVLAACGGEHESVLEEATRVPVVSDAAAQATRDAAAAPPEGEQAATPESGGETGTPALAAEIVSVDIAFQPAEVTIPANTDVKFTLPNNGAAPHNFSIDALGISVDQAPGSTEEVVINAPAGEYEYYCKVPGHKEAGMVGKLIVSEDAAAEAPAAAGDATAPAPAEGEAAAEQPAAATATAEVVSVDIAFQPAELTIPANTDVTVNLPNQGAAPHNFSIDALGISVDQAPGATESVVINAPAGEYEYYCNVPGHKEAGMVGKLIVSEDAAAPATAEEAAAPAPAEGDAAATESAAAAAAEVVAVDIAFQPTELTIPANTDVTVSMPNNGAAPHNFSIDALGISVDLPPGATESVVINAPAGEYEYYCNVPGHKEAGMVGKLIVSEEVAATADTTGATPEATAEQSAATPVPATAAATPLADASPVADDNETASAAAQAVEVVSVDIAFQPNEVTIPANTDVTFTLPNQGAAPHNFAIDELGISVDQAPGSTEEVVINAPAGSYEFYCNVPGHKEAGMTGTLTVE